MTINKTTQYTTNPDTIPVTSGSGQDQTITEAFNDRVIEVSSISERDALDSGLLNDGQQISVQNDRTYYWDAGTSQFILSDFKVSDNGSLKTIEQYVKDRGKLTASQRQITFDNYTKHKAFGITDTLPSGRILMVYREGDEHSVTEAVLKKIYSDDGGLSWSAPESVLTQTGRDLRNCSGGVDSQGNFHVIFESLLISSDDNKTSVITSSDDGATWTSPTDVFSTLTATRLPCYGKLVETSNDIFVLTRNTASGQIRKIRSDDFGVTWTMAAILDPTITEFTELSAVNVGSNRIIAVGRNNSTVNTNALMITSTDDGVNWSAESAISQVIMGKNPPMLHLDDSNNRLHLIFPSRTDDSLTTGGTGQLWPWYTSSVDVDEIFTGSNNWRKPRALPIFSPEQGATPGGDSSYPHLVKVDGQVLMTYYLGNFDDGGGTDFYISNMTSVAGIL